MQFQYYVFGSFFVDVGDVGQCCDVIGLDYVCEFFDGNVGQYCQCDFCVDVIDFLYVVE